MLRSRFRRSSLETPLAAIAAPGGTVKGSEVGHSSEATDLAVTPSCLDCGLCAALLWPGHSHHSLHKPTAGERRREAVAKKWKEASEELLNLCKQ